MLCGIKSLCANIPDSWKIGARHFEEARFRDVMALLSVKSRKLEDRQELASAIDCEHSAL